MAFLDELNTYTVKHIVPGVVDNVFQNDPLLAYIRQNEPQTFPGGAAIQNNFWYGVLKGGFYAKGAQFDTTRRQTTTGATFQPKFTQVNVTEFKEDLQVQIRGPHAVFSQIDSDMQNAALTMSAILAIAFYNEGQTAARANYINGLAEICNDGTGNSWTGATYATYGTLTRGGTIGSALNSVPRQISGRISYPILVQRHNEAMIGLEHPNLAVTTNLGMAYVEDAFQPQQRITSVDPTVGFRGLEFKDARFMPSQYAPGTAGVNDADLGNYLVTTGETIWFLNTKWFQFWSAEDPEFAFGFTGFKPGRDDTIVSGQYLWSGNTVCTAPRLQKQLYDVTG